MKVRSAIVYEFSFSNPDHVEIFNGQCQRLATQGYKPLLQPSIFGDTIIQQWGREDESKITSYDFRLFIYRVMLEFKEKWDNRTWAVEYEKFDEWLYLANPTWCMNKSAQKLYRRFAIEHYSNADLLNEGYCLKRRFK